MARASKKQTQAREFLHLPLGEEFESVSGSYSMVKQGALDFEGREVLYLLGIGVFDSTCCGSGGCYYALVPGFLLKRRVREAEDGGEVSLVEPIRDDRAKRSVEAALKDKENVSQVNFL